MGKPKPSYKHCTCCGADTLLAFAGLEYHSYVISLCSDCAKTNCKIMLDMTCGGTALKYTLKQLTKHGRKNNTTTQNKS